MEPVRTRVRHLHEFEQQTIGVWNHLHPLSKAFDGTLNLCRFERHTQCLTDTAARFPYMAPREKCQDAAWCSVGVGVVEVVRCGVVIVDRPLHQAHPPGRGVVVEILLWVAGQCGDVMQAQQCHE